MPELPDIIVYLEALSARLTGQRLLKVVLKSPFVLRSVDPPLNLVEGKLVTGFRRLGKRVVFELEDDLFIVLHLMIAGRLRWRTGTEPLKVAPRLVLAEFEFDRGTLFFTEAGSKKRASIRVVRGDAALRTLDRDGLEPFAASPDDFRAALRRENHTLKRALTDPHLFSGIGNAYSDEILHAARLSPLKLSQTLEDAEIDRLHQAVIHTLSLWVDRLRVAADGGFPEKVTAFREDMAVHGRFKRACPVCGSAVQRIVYAENECNYCPTCQTGGRILADRALSRLLK